MACSGVLKAVALGGVLVLPGVMAVAQDNSWIELQGVEVELLEDGRLVLVALDGRSYELAGLRVLEQCEGAAGSWACGEAARQLLQGAVRGEKLDCLVLEAGKRPAVECRAQTRNLNLWLVRRPGVELAAEWSDRPAFSRYREAEQSGQAMRDLARAVAERDPLQIRSRGPSALSSAAFVDRVTDGAPWKTLALSERVERRGATAAERGIIADGLLEDGIRAGVWELGGLRVIVGEDIESCLQYIWCTFAVVDAAGHVVLSGTARGAPRVADADGSEAFVLVWQEPGGAWQQWSR